MSTFRRIRIRVPLLAVLAFGNVATLPAAQAADEAAGSLYTDGLYASVLGRYLVPDGKSDLDSGFGAALLAGVRRDIVALEVAGHYTRVNPATLIGGNVNGLFFPFRRLPGLYALVGVGAVNVRNYPGIGDVSFNVTNIDGGVGYIFPLRFGNYHFGLRAEVLYEYGIRQKRMQDQSLPADPLSPTPATDLPIDPKPSNIIGQLGLHLPFGAAPVPPPPEPVAVVTPAAVVDGDGDGVPDPADRCPDSPAGSKVDAQGCPLAPPCKSPESGTHIALGGCKAGDSVVLRGVNFEFDRAQLTVDAKTILDGVADELRAHPDIDVELDGYTDDKGSEQYNQQLSEERATAVVRYLQIQGVDVARMHAVGYGEAQPVADNGTDEGRELNRRVELKILSRAAADVAKAGESPALSGDAASAAGEAVTPAAGEPVSSVAESAAGAP